MFIDVFSFLQVAHSFFIISYMMSRLYTTISTLWSIHVCPTVAFIFYFITAEF